MLDDLAAEHDVVGAIVERDLLGLHVEPRVVQHDLLPADPRELDAVVESRLAETIGERQLVPAEAPEEQRCEVRIGTDLEETSRSAGDEIEREEEPAQIRFEVRPALRCGARVPCHVAV